MYMRKGNSYKLFGAEVLNADFAVVESQMGLRYEKNAIEWMKERAKNPGVTFRMKVIEYTEYLPK